MSKLILKPFNNKRLVSVIKRHCHHHSKTNFCKFTDQANPSSQLEELNLKVAKLDREIMNNTGIVSYCFIFNVIIIPFSILIVR
jgi:hypothetical protein